MKLVPVAAPGPARRTLSMGNLIWRVAAHKRTAVRNIEHALGALSRLRGLYDDAGLDEMLAEYRSVLDIVRSLDPARPPPAQDLLDLQERLAVLQRRLDPALGSPAAATGHRAGPGPHPGGDPAAD